MKLLKTIFDKQKDEGFNKRLASRAVLFDENNLIPILFVSKQNYHMLPGGGIEKGENKLEALKREILEEVGSEIKVKGEIGKIIEYRSKFNLKQISYCYYGIVLSKGKSNLEQSEIDDGFELKWLKLDDAINVLKKDKPLIYEGNFIKERDLKFISEARKICVDKL